MTVLGALPPAALDQAFRQERNRFRQAWQSLSQTLDATGQLPAPPLVEKMTGCKNPVIYDRRRTMHQTAQPAGYEIDIQEDLQTGQFIATIPALGLSKQGAFDEVSAWSMEELAKCYGIAAAPAHEAAS